MQRSATHTKGSQLMADKRVPPQIFTYTLGCMVARTTNALAVANGPPPLLSGKHWLIESWCKSAVPGVSRCMVCSGYKSHTP